uniref:Heat shock protein 70 n=1 Tax=Acrobeloides nanus TaxID=290746 RepID=A0A914E3C0_9BILA
MKRLIGNKNAVDCIQENGKYWTFKVECGSEAVIELNVDGKLKRIKPEEVSSQILIKLKKAAEDVTQHPIKNIVLTVPAYFDENQKKATIKAAELASLNVLELISEPSAAAYAYEYNKRQASNLNLLVFDFGGGTLDVVIVKVKNGNFDVMAIGGDTQLGGRDFDNVLMGYFMDIIVKKYKKNIIKKDEKSVRAQQKLLKECIDLKHMLTADEEANLYLGEIFPDIDENIEMDRSTFNKICHTLFHRIEMVIHGTLKEAGMAPKDINEVVLVGGSSRIPEIKELLLKIFPIKELNKTLNPDEAIAYGATLRATQIINNSIPNITLTEENALRSQKLYAKLKQLDIGPTGKTLY